ncbi:radical SAM/SPASM domain-containing protein [Streptomyces sp. NPDC002776]
MKLPADLVLLNWRCSPHCRACPSGEDLPSSPDGVAAALQERQGRTPLVYLGIEALAEPGLLPDLVATAARHGTHPILLTRGGPDLPLQDIARTLATLKNHGSFEIVWALDLPHYQQLDDHHVNAVLETLTGPGTPALHLLCVLPEGAAPPLELLAKDTLNQGSQVVTRPGRTLADYLSRCAPGVLDLSRPAAESVLPPQRTPSSATRADYPLAFNALIFETTYFCNAKCTHCYTSCGPDSPRTRLSVADVTRVIDETADLPNVARRCHFAGGEATIYWRELMAMLHHSARHGFINTLTTNGFWGSSPERAQRKMADLADAAVHTVELSADAMHQDFIKPAVLGNIIQAGRDHNIDIVLRVCTTRDNRISDVLPLIDPTLQNDLVILAEPAIGTGRAATEVPEAKRWQIPGLPLGACADVLNLVVTPDGGVFPCCSGSELCPTLTLGNIHDQSLTAMMQNSRSNVLLRTLVHAGPSYFAQLMADSPLAERLRPAYGSYCELCTQIFTDTDLTAFVRDHVQRKTREKLAALKR